MSDGYLPYVFDLSSGNVQRIQTSSADPRVTFDKTGLRGTAADGSANVFIDAIGGTAFFRGVVTAQGLILPAGSVDAAPATNQVQWTTVGGGVVARIVGWEGSGVDGLNLHASPQGGSNAASVGLYSDTGAGPQNASLHVDRGADGASGASTKVGGSVTNQFGGGLSYTVLDSAAESSFPRFPSAKRSTIAIGTVTWPGLTAVSNSFQVVVPQASGLCAALMGCSYVQNAGLGGGFVDTAVVNATSFLPLGTISVACEARGGGSPVAGSQCEVFVMAWER